ncbi:MAG TPA: hypothetical protein VHO50_00405 [Bacteroidales bacterium]|nr:hypothetical protein [Bacteroidales bacterium]
MEYRKLLLKVSTESSYMRYKPMKIVIRSVPGEEIKFYAKLSGCSERIISGDFRIMKMALKDCEEISKEEYDQF